MKFKLHNKAEVLVGENKYIFFNKMNENVFEKLSKLESFNNFVAIGNGIVTQGQKMQKLNNFIKKYHSNSQIIQNNIENGELFIMKQIVVGDEFDNYNYITEIGFCDNDEINPNIYNYITFISEDLPNGIKKNFGEKIVINLYIYLSLSPQSLEFLCAGNNKILSFLMGEGLAGQIYAVRGHNLSENKVIKREIPHTNEKFLASVIVEKDDEFRLSFESDLSLGETDEVVFVCEDCAVARINVLNIKNATNNEEIFVSKLNNTIDLGVDIKSINEVYDIGSQIAENNYVIKKYATRFADKIYVPFFDLFNYQTPRFLSKDGKKLFFVKNDFVYGFENVDFQLKELFVGNLYLQHIKKIIAFDNLVFFVTKVAPFIHCYEIENESLKALQIDFAGFEFFAEIETAAKIDVVQSNSGTYMIAMVLADGRGVTAYFEFSDKKFHFLESRVSDYEFSYLVAIHKNNFCDARIVFIKGGEYSYEARLVTHYPDKEVKDVATVLAYELTNNTKEIYVKGRSIIVEKITEPFVDLYYFPSLEKYNLSIIQNEVDDYFSSDMLYLIQKYQDANFKMFNLVGFNEPVEFADDISNFVDFEKIKSFEFLNDTLLIFLEDGVVALNLKNNGTLIENVSMANSEYKIGFCKYDKIGKNNEGVRAKLTLKINI